jgi:diacylglycerol O-acyltransferase / wax synthase
MCPGADWDRRYGSTPSRIAAATAARKRDVRPRSGAVLGGRAVRLLALRILAAQRMMNTYVANVPGPPQPLYFAGAAVRELLPIVALMGNIALGVGALSYAGQVTITVVGDRDSCSDVDIVARGVNDTLDSLTSQH